MSVAVPDSAYITAPVPDAMREGMDLAADVARPTGMALSTDDTIKVEEGTRDGDPLIRVRLPRPAHIPAGPPKLAPVTPQPVAFTGALSYDFPLLPAVQCRISFAGDVTADHLEQLLCYLDVACKKLREQEARPQKSTKKAKPDAD